METIKRRRLNLVVLLFAATYAYNCLGPAPQTSGAALANDAPLTFAAGSRRDAGAFLSAGSGFRLRLTSERAELRLLPPAEPPIAVAVRWAGAQAGVGLRADAALPGEAARHRRVRYSSVYPGIDVVFYGNPQRLEYDFIVAPGARPESIGLVFDGVERVDAEARTGDLLLRVGARVIRQHAPVAYQEVTGIRVPVLARYVVNAGAPVSIALGPFDRTLPLVIDPILEW